jgi:hypothetical protein
MLLISDICSINIVFKGFAFIFRKNETKDKNFSGSQVETQQDNKISLFHITHLAISPFDNRSFSVCGLSR